jgi:tetratricopeptide (TPR) repeat protein
MSQSYSREGVRRLLGISEKQLASWETQKLVKPTDAYGFRDLVALRTLVQLRKSHVPAEKIRRAIHALAKKLHNVEDPLTQLKLYSQGKRIRVDLEGKAMEAESGQLLFNFDAEELSRLLQFRAKEKPSAEQDNRRAAEHWFQQGLDLEQNGAPLKEIIEAYKKAVELDAHSAGALVNLGTLYFNSRNWLQAERYYKQAIEADPEYALAHFDLANLYDERGDPARALEHYLIALKLSPTYADAHYNVALLYQGANKALKAVHHWMTYLKLDPSSQWAGIARRELAKLRKASVVQGSRR